MAVTDIIASPASIWYAPVGTTLPDETTIAYGASWGGTWVNLGYTLEPITVNMTTERFDLMVQQLLVPVRSVRTLTDVMLETTLAEFSGTNLALVTDGTKTTTAAGASQKGYDEITVDAADASMSLYAFGIEGVRIHSSNAQLPVRVFLPRATIALNGAMQFAKDAGAGLPVQIKALVDPASTTCMIIHNVTAPTT